MPALHGRKQRNPGGILSGASLCILDVYTFGGGLEMATAKVFKSGNSQAVRLPKQFRLKSKEVEISRRGAEIGFGGRPGTIARGLELIAGGGVGLGLAWGGYG